MEFIHLTLKLYWIIILVHFLNRKFNKNNNTSERECSVDQRVTLECEGNINDDTVAEHFGPEDEEGYNVYDARYVSWIQATHPKNNSQELLNFFLM